MSDSPTGNGPQPDDAYFATAEGPRRPLFPGVDLRSAACENLMLCVVNLEANSEVPDHAHPHEQMGYLVSGRLEFTVGGVTRVLGPGDLWKIPGGVRHSVRALDGPAVALDVFHPIRQDYL